MTVEHEMTAKVMMTEKTSKILNVGPEEQNMIEEYMKEEEEEKMVGQEATMKGMTSKTLNVGQEEQNMMEE